MSGWGTPCQDNNGNNTSSGANVMTVPQTAHLPTWIAGMFGLQNFTITATATATMAGGQYTPDNIAILVDTTNSMSSNDPGTQTACSNKSQIACALLGAQKLLGELNPCSSGTTCTSGSLPVNTVSLFVFPAVSSATKSNDYFCPTTNPTIEPYTFQNTTAANPNFNPPVNSSTGIPLYAYQITNWSTDYRSSVGANALNPNSDIVVAVGDSGVGGCNGTSAAFGCTSANNCSPTSYTYPSALGECGQAVVAAQAAAAAGTKVETIGYGSETSGCTTDKTYSATVGSVPGVGCHGFRIAVCLFR